MRKFVIALAVVAVGISLLVAKIKYEEHKSDREMEQQGKQNMCKIVGC